MGYEHDKLGLGDFEQMYSTCTLMHWLRTDIIIVFIYVSEFERPDVEHFLKQAQMQIQNHNAQIKVMIQHPRIWKKPLCSLEIPYPTISAEGKGRGRRLPSTRINLFRDHPVRKDYISFASPEIHFIHLAIQYIDLLCNVHLQHIPNLKFYLFHL